MLKAQHGIEKEIDNWDLLLQDHGELAPRDKPKDELMEAWGLCKSVVNKPCSDV